MEGTQIRINKSSAMAKFMINIFVVLLICFWNKIVTRTSELPIMPTMNVMLNVMPTIKAIRSSNGVIWPPLPLAEKLLGVEDETLLFTNIWCSNESIFSFSFFQISSLMLLYHNLEKLKKAIIHMKPIYI